MVPASTPYIGASPLPQLPPAPHSRMWVADHLGTAADAISAATRRWDMKPLCATGIMLERAAADLYDVLPDLQHMLGQRPDIFSGLRDAYEGVSAMAISYARNEMPLAGRSVALSLARYAYRVRAAQGALLGISSNRSITAR